MVDELETKPGDLAPADRFMSPEHFIGLVRSHVAGIIFDPQTLPSGNIQLESPIPHEAPDINGLILLEQFPDLTRTPQDAKWLISVNPKAGANGIAIAFLTQVLEIDKTLVNATGERAVATQAEWEKRNKELDERKMAARAFYQAHGDVVDQEIVRLRESAAPPLAPSHARAR